MENAITMREVCKGKMSVALQAMIDGIENPEGFHVDMQSYVSYDMVTTEEDYQEFSLGDVNCTACAATLALQKLMKVKFTEISVKKANLHQYEKPGRIWNSIGNILHYNRSVLPGLEIYDPVDIQEFEKAMDRFRSGFEHSLINYMEYSIEQENKVRRILQQVPIKISNFDLDLTAAKAIVSLLQKAGL